MNNNENESLKPVSKKDRIKELDIIRGFALFGVLLVNIAMFNTTLFTKSASLAPLSNPLQLATIQDRLAALFIKIFAEGKFYTIFSFLFGLGFYIFMQRAEKKSTSTTKLFIRRSLFLFIFGILHFIFVWYGDILHVYGIIGFFLLLFKNSSLKTIKIWIIILLLFSTLFYSGFTLLNTLNSSLMDSNTLENQKVWTNNQMKESVEVYQTGTFLEVITYRISNEGIFLFMNLFVIIPKILGMFLIGLYVGKKGILEDIDGHLDYIRKICKITGVVGLLVSVLYVCIDYEIINLGTVLNSPTTKFFEELATVFVSMFYVTSLILLLKKMVFNKLLIPLRYMGQMALTNYLVQCILCSIIFYGYGFGLLNKIGVATGVILTIGIYGTQLIISKKWLQHFRYGPFEWIWRKLTYGNSI